MVFKVTYLICNRSMFYFLDATQIFRGAEFKLGVQGSRDTAQINCSNLRHVSKISHVVVFTTWTIVNEARTS